MRSASRCESRLRLGELAAAPADERSRDAAAEDDVMQRALAHPEVQRFQEVFPEPKCAPCEI